MKHCCLFNFWVNWERDKMFCLRADWQLTFIIFVILERRLSAKTYLASKFLWGNEWLPDTYAPHKVGPSSPQGRSRCWAADTHRHSGSATNTPLRGEHKWRHIKDILFYTLSRVRTHSIPFRWNKITVEQVFFVCVNPPSQPAKTIGNPMHQNQERALTIT